MRFSVMVPDGFCTFGICGLLMFFAVGIEGDDEVVNDFGLGRDLAENDACAFVRSSGSCILSEKSEMTWESSSENNTLKISTSLGSIT